MSSEITQALRRFPDVRIVTSGELYGINVLCLDNNDGALACSLAITLFQDYDRWEKFLKPGDSEYWKAFAGIYNRTPRLVCHQVYNVGTSKFEWFARDIAATLNTELLEGARQAQEKSIHPRSSNPVGGS